MSSTYSLAANIYGQATIGDTLTCRAINTQNNNINAGTGTLTCGDITCTSISSTTAATAITPATADNSTKVATTAYVKAQGYTTGAGYAPLASPTFTGGAKVTGIYETSTYSITYVTGDSGMNDGLSIGTTSFSGGLRGVVSSTDRPVTSINANWGLIVTNGSILIHGLGIVSDKRIKTNIKDVEGNDCLTILRKLQPKIYNYIDYQTNGSGSKFGFIAQEMESIFPSCVNTYVDFIPNIFEKCNVINGNKIVMSNKSTDLFKNNTKTNNIKIKYYDASNNFFTRTIESIIDDKSFIVDENIDESEIFLYGQEVSDYRNIDYTSVFSFVTAAVKELDIVAQQQQIEIEKLKEQNETLENRLTLLENRLTAAGL